MEHTTANERFSHLTTSKTEAKKKSKVKIKLSPITGLGGLQGLRFKNINGTYYR
jgi:hypothetical protein